MVKVFGILMLAATVAVPKSCNISFGSGSNNPSAPSTFTLPVPFFMQLQEFSCGPASIEMWAAYDGISVTQQQIGQYIGCGPNGNTSGGQLASGVQHFTVSGRDASLVYAGGEGPPSTILGLFYSAEVTSITALVPVLPIVNNGLHAVVIIGGQWHIDPSSGLYVWDTVIFNDPAVGPGQVMDAASWTGYDGIQHVISSSASAEAYDNYIKYNAQVALRGAGLGGKPLPY